MTTPPDYIVKNWLTHEIFELNEKVVRDYLNEHGLSELPWPEYVSADTARLWSPVTQDGKIVGYESILYRATPDSLVRALEKGFLLAPPEVNPDGVDAAVESESGPAERAEGQAEPLGSTPFEGSQETVFKCNRKWANGKTCEKTYKSAGFLAKHVREKHEGK